ncbi:MAG: PAS domain-containing protein [Halieaceae bacterium]|nr:PAS domain-containing protein [Halieaceae bacterium]
METVSEEKKGLSLGAVDYITKPIHPAILLARVKNHVMLKQAHDFLRDKNAYLEKEVNRRLQERIGTEELLQEKEAHLSHAQRIAHLGSWSLDLIENKLECSAEMYRLFEIEAKGGADAYQNFVDIVHPEDLQSVQKEYRQSLKSQLPYESEYRLLMSDGRIKYAYYRSETSFDDEGIPLKAEGIVQDITERKLAQAQIVQASKMSTLGEMATSVAHELNQPLNVIRMATGNILRKMSAGIPTPEYLSKKLQRISDQTERAATIIDHMRMFGRRASEQPSKIDPTELVRSALDLIGEQLRLAQIEVELNLPEVCPLILGHQVQGEQVLLNLLTNARDAISSRQNPDGRKISVGINVCEDKTIEISVEDTGGGIEDNVIQRIFEPFYTTKDMGEGTGLGLSVSWGIIRDMGGTISAKNTGQGAKFVISLPQAGDTDTVEDKTGAESDQ